jgi:peptidoglycan hydrolase-like protein with peptidoglycan-binding domain
MKRSWLRRALGLAATVVLVCSFVSAESGATSTQSTAKKATKTTTSATKSKSARSSTAHKKATRKGKRSKRVRGQQKIDAERTHQIQEALIRQHYLTGQPTGKWDAATEDALRRFQAANGWQNKTVPDSRALIKLGLGPNHDHLLNPESAMTTTPEPSQSNVTTPTVPASNGTPATANQPQR